MEAEESLQCVEEATFELLELQKQFENRLVDQEGSSRRENVRIHGVKEGAEDNATSMIDFSEIDKKSTLVVVSKKKTRSFTPPLFLSNKSSREANMTSRDVSQKTKDQIYKI